MAKKKPVSRRERLRREKQADKQWEKDHPLSASTMTAIAEASRPTRQLKIHAMPYNIELPNEKN